MIESLSNHSFHESEPLADGRRTLRDRSISAKFSSSEIFFQGKFEGSWELLPQKSNIKPYREGESITFDPLSQNFYFAYGLEENEKYSDSVYAYNINSQDWTKLDIKGTKKKAYCGSTFADNKLWFFGGSIHNDFIQDFHYIDLKTNEAVYPETKGTLPSKCHSPLVFHHNTDLIVWTPATRSTSSSLHILNLNTMTWSLIETEHVYRLGAAASILDDRLYILGTASSSETVISLNLNDYSLTVLQATGEDPPCAPESMFVRTMGEYIVLVSSSCEEKTPCLYFFIPKKALWLKIIYKKRELKGHAISFFADKKANALYLLLRYTQEECSERSVEIACINAGVSMAFINHELDMMQMLF